MRARALVNFGGLTLVLGVTLAILVPRLVSADPCDGSVPEPSAPCGDGHECADPDGFVCAGTTRIQSPVSKSCDSSTSSSDLCQSLGDVVCTALFKCKLNSDGTQCEAGDPVLGPNNKPVRSVTEGFGSVSCIE